MAHLVYADTDGVERSLTVGAEPVVVGRATECAIRSSDPRVSRNHARFYVDHTGALHVEDLGSSNGVFVGSHRVTHSAVPINELVLVGSLTFRLVAFEPAPEPHDAATMLHAEPPPPEPAPPAAWPQPATQPAAAKWAQAATPPAAAPWPEPAQPAWSPPAPASWPQPAEPAWSPPAPAHAGSPWASAPAPQADPNAALLEAERKARLAAEEERDAYGTRMSELHHELRTVKHELDAARAELARPRVVTGDAEIQRHIDELVEERARLSVEVDLLRERVADADERTRSAEARLRSAEEELSVARSDLLASEDRLVSEIAAHEQRSGAELASRVDELEVSRADLNQAEERILDLSRTVSELEQRVAQLPGGR